MGKQIRECTNIQILYNVLNTGGNSPPKIKPYRDSLSASGCTKTEQQNIQGNKYICIVRNYLLRSEPTMPTAVRVPASAETPKQNFRDKPGQNEIWKVLGTCWFPKRECTEIS
jgi:hypothetical protein